MIAITGGGTGGHLAVAAAVADALNDIGIPAIFIGSSHGQDRQWFEGDSRFSHAYFLPTRGVMNKGLFGKVFSLATIGAQSIRILRYFRRHRIKGVLSVGGYAAAPAAFAAILSRTPLCIHEQNAVTGSLNRLLTPFAKALFSSFHTPTPCPDYPIRPAFFQSARKRETVGHVIFLGGSQGATAINDLAIALVDDGNPRPV